MKWNWQNPEWPKFTWNQEKMIRAERIFLEETGMASGASMHLALADKETFTVELMTGDALDTSKIEGETLDRDSVQSSIRRGLGLKVDRKRVSPAEAGIADMTVNNFKTYSNSLDHETLFAWHGMVAGGRLDLDMIGRYRDHAEPMQIVSGAGLKRRVHFEAPPSEKVKSEMGRLIRWFNKTTPSKGNPSVPVLVRAGIVHLWFESIHPFEDGNGRIGRAVAEKAIMQGLSNPIVTALSTTLLKHRKEYYQALEKASKTLEVTDWLLWFSSIAIESGRHCLGQVQFLIDKTRLLDSLRNQLNSRQEKALVRMFAAGPDGFVGGLSAKNYATITGAASATVTRDLTDLVAKGALTKTGERKATRYHLSIRVKPVAGILNTDIL